MPYITEEDYRKTIEAFEVYERTVEKLMKENEKLAGEVRELKEENKSIKKENEELRKRLEEKERAFTALLSDLNKLEKKMDATLEKSSPLTELRMKIHQANLLNIKG